MDDGLEAGVGGARGRQLDRLEAGSAAVVLRRTAGEDGHRQPGLLHGLREGGGAPPMADAEQMLDMEEDPARGHGASRLDRGNGRSNDECSAGLRPALRPLPARSPAQRLACRLEAGATREPALITPLREAKGSGPRPPCCRPRPDPNESPTSSLP